MHYTLRLAIQHGTPVDPLRDPYTHTEHEDTEGIVYALEDIARTARAFIEANPGATAHDLNQHLVAENGADWEDGTPWGERREQEAQLRALAADVEDVCLRVEGADRRTLTIVAEDMLGLAPDWEEGTFPPDRRGEAISNLRMARERVEATYNELRHTELGGGLEHGSDGLGEALADINQAIRFLNGSEVPA